MISKSNTNTGVSGPARRGGRPRKTKITLPGISMRVETLGPQTIEIQSRPNPYFNRAHAGSSGNPKFVSVAVNVNESAIMRLHSNGKIDDFQARAAYRFRSLFEAFASSTPSPSNIRERIDGAGAPDVFTDRRIDAGLKLRAIPPLMTSDQYRALQMVCGEGVPIEVLRRRLQTRRDRARALLLDALDILVDHWGMKPGHGD